MNSFWKFGWTLLAVLMIVSGAWATAINTSALSQNGWYSDDTRADDAGLVPLGTSLVSPTLTDLPESASGNAAHDAKILEQLIFGAASGTVPSGTYPGAVRLFLIPANPGK